MGSPSAPALTRELIAYNTTNPPGRERTCAVHVGRLLETAGFRVAYHDFAPGRTNLIAHLEEGHGPALCLCGHLDTVPLGNTAWTRDPFAGDTEGDRLYGRGASDMKSGVAAMVAAALRVARLKALKAPLLLIMTAGEETGCEGALFLARRLPFPCRVGALVVGEPTANYPLIGHKGALWLEARTRGVAAHGSMPDRGVNAIHKAADLVLRLGGYAFKAAAHPLLGGPTLNVGTIYGGTRINMVPDEAVVGLDIRTVPGQSHEEIVADLGAFLAEDVALERLASAESVVTDPRNDWVQDVFQVMAGFLGETPEPRAAPYFTDASALTPACGHPPTLLLGPGQPEMAHKTDEFCSLHRIEEAEEAYFEIARKWCGP